MWLLFSYRVHEYRTSQKLEGRWACLLEFEAWPVADPWGNGGDPPMKLNVKGFSSQFLQHSRILLIIHKLSHQDSSHLSPMWLIESLGNYQCLVCLARLGEPTSTGEGNYTGELHPSVKEEHYKAWSVCKG